MRLIEKVWFSGHNAKWVLVPVLFPLTIVFWLISSLRRLAFRLRFSQTNQVELPVIVVGNIGVGGNGKTPLVIHLIELCRQQELSPGVISRGYGGKLPEGQSYPLTLTQYTPVEHTGDEPYLIYHRCNVPVVVGPDRVASAQQLKMLGCDVIIADDGLQHYRMSRDCEIIVVDGKRGFGNGLLLPAGPLREGQWRLNTANHVVVNGVNNVNLAIESEQMTLQASDVINLSTGERYTVEQFLTSNVVINAVAGIGDPSRFFDTLTNNGFDVRKSQSFVDHHHYNKQDFEQFELDTPLLMTEKDAVKCKAFSASNWWYLAVNAGFSDADDEKFKSTINKVVEKKLINKA